MSALEPNEPEQQAHNAPKPQGEDHSPSGEYPVNDQESSKIQVPVDHVQDDDIEAFSNRPTDLPPPPSNETVEAPVESGRQVIAKKTTEILKPANDNRLHSDNLDEAFQAFEEHAPYQAHIDHAVRDAKLTEEVEMHFKEQERAKAYFELGRKNRGFFTKIADAASHVWSGTTPEERARGQRNTGGIRGLFISEAQRLQELMQKTGISSAPTSKNVQSSMVEEVKSAASKVVAGVGGFFKKLFPPRARKAVAAGAVVVGATVLGMSECGRGGCNGNHPGHVGPVASATSSSDAGKAPAPSQSVAQVPAPAPSDTTNEEPEPTPKPIDQEPKHQTYKPAPKLAKISTLPKTNVYHPPKIVEKPKKTGELKECADDTKLTATTLDKCLVKAEDADKLRKDLLTQVDEQQKVLNGVYAPMNGPAFVSMNPYRKDSKQLDFLTDAGKKEPGQYGQMMPVNPQSDVNAANKKIVDESLTKARGLIAAARTPKDFYTITELLGNIGIRIDSLIADRGKQIAANVDAANELNMKVAKDKISEIEKNTGKTINAVPFSETRQHGTVTKSTIDIPVTKELLNSNESAVLDTPRTGDDPDKIIASVQTKLGYYRSLLDLNRTLDDVRVQQHTADVRLREAMKAAQGSNGGSVGASARKPRMSASLY